MNHNSGQFKQNLSIRKCEKQIQRIYRAAQIFSRTLQFPSSHQDATSLLHLQALKYWQGTKFSKNQDPVIMNNEQKHTKTNQSGGYPILRNRHLQVVSIYSEDCSHQGTQIPKPYRTGFSAQSTFKPKSQSY